MSILKKTGGFTDEIRCDEPSYLIWKWRPRDAKPGSNRENSVRCGSSLRVKDGEVAVFVYKQKSGVMQDYIIGPYDQIIKTANLPVLAKIIGAAYDSGTPFQAEIYFINLSHIVQVKFAVPYFDVFDPRFTDVSIPVAVRGTISFRIENYNQFIKLHRLNSFDLNDFQNQISSAVSRYVKDIVANAPAENNIPVIQIESKIALINDKIEYAVSERLNKDFGVSVSGVDINAIDIDKSSNSYSELMAITKDAASAVIHAQRAADIKNIHDKQRIDANNYEETLRIQREESQYAQHKQTQSSNLSAFQTEMSAGVGIAGAEALGKMGANNAGSVNLGCENSFNPAAIAASMALGSAVGQNISTAINSGMSGINQTSPQSAVTPPIPLTSYHVAVNGQAAGPFDISTLKQMAESGQFNADSLVWKNGMTEWAKASETKELAGIFKSIIPPIPNKK